MDNPKDYFCAEFQLKESNLLYQFKLRKDAGGELYAVVGKDSRALENLKQGDKLAMRYYCLDKTIPADIRHTRIRYVDKSKGFPDHYSIGLEIDSKDMGQETSFPGIPG